MKTLLTFLLLIAVFPVLSQDVVLNYPMTLGRSLKDQRACYPVVDRQTGNVFLVVYNHKSITVITLKPDFSVIGEQVQARPESSQEILGHAVSESHLTLYFNTAASSKLTRLTLNLNSDEAQVDRIDVGESNEKYLNSFSVDNNFMVLQSVKNSNVLALHAYAPDGRLTSTQYDFSSQKFSLEEVNDLDGILRREKPEYIETKIPNPLEIASAKSKIYKTDTSLVLTLDNEKYRTAVLNLPLNNNNANVKFMNHAFTDCEQSLTYSSNSYVFQGYLYQFKVCQSAMAVSINDLATGTPAKTFTVQREGEINFKNTDIIQEGSETNPQAKRELSKTKQFLRKCSYSNAAISVYPQRDELVMVVGSFKEIVRGGPGVPMYSPATQISTPGGTVTMPGSYNPVHVGYGTSRSSKAVYFKSKLKTPTFEHSPGLVFDDAFKKIKKYSEVHLQEKNYLAAGDITSVPLIAETLFKKEERYYLGYYDKEKKQYTLREFRY